jgi:hypothetical protein
MFTPDSVLRQQFAWQQKGQVVRDLQAILGVSRDGVYSKETATRHTDLLAAKGLPITLAGTPPK